MIAVQFFGHLFGYGYFPAAFHHEMGIAGNYFNMHEVHEGTVGRNEVHFLSYITGIQSVGYSIEYGIVFYFRVIVLQTFS